MDRIIKLSEYENMAPEEKRQWAERWRERLGQDFERMDFDPSRELFPTFWHRAAGMPFKLILEGSFEMGFSAEEERWARKICDPIPANLEEMRPVHPREVNPFLLSVTPVLQGQVEVGSKTADREFSPAFVQREIAETYAEGVGCRLPREMEWEYACRGGSQTLFPWGNELLPEAELEAWLAWDFRDLGKVRVNRFGLGGLCSGEWCADEFSKSYEAGAETEPGSFVIRGGGSFFWPWQDEEWVWCMPAMRMPSKDLVDGTCGFRLVFDLAKK